MLNSDKIKHSVMAMVAALVFTTIAIGAAVGPARAIETAQPVSAQPIA